MDVRRLQKIEKVLIPKVDKTDISNMTIEEQEQRIAELTYKFMRVEDRQGEYSHLSEAEFVKIYLDADADTQARMGGFRDDKHKKEMLPILLKKYRNEMKEREANG
jgi:hypothetical protein